MLKNPSIYCVGSTDCCRTGAAFTDAPREGKPQMNCKFGEWTLHAIAPSINGQLPTRRVCERSNKRSNGFPMGKDFFLHGGLLTGRPEHAVSFRPPTSRFKHIDEHPRRECQNKARDEVEQKCRPSEKHDGDLMQADP
jgi:hypothetical protein